uniref:glutaminase n=1 Tax=Salmo trutta TaxID=8032 RepID=A0A673Z281_SALTR
RVFVLCGSGWWFFSRIFYLCIPGVFGHCSLLVYFYVLSSLLYFYVLLIGALKKTGLNASDPRLKDCMDKLQRSVTESFHDVMMDRELFHKCVGGNIVLLIQAFRKKFIIPEFDSFVTKIDQIYDTVQKNHDGHVAVYIPHLAKFSPDLWGVSLCTVDGQRHSVGESKQPFCLQSCVKPLEYAVAIHEAGTEKVHRYVGMEPSGLKFNKLYLDEEDKPHNPMVNAGAIVISSLIKVSRKTVMDFIKKMAGQEYVGFSNATFQSEKETGDRNFAIGYYLKEKKCFPRGAEMIDALDFYFQLCSIEVTCESGSVMAATLAHGGICPITGERVLSAEAVRNTLSLMHSCGMYDFSGQMAFHVGLPAKSGVSGAVLLVVPNVMGVMCWSPPLDKVGNSVRGIHFCQELVSSFNFHNYDNLRHFVKKQDPRRQDGDDRVRDFMRPKWSSLASTQLAVFGGMLPMTPRTPSPQSNMEVETLCFGGVFLLRGQDNFTASKGRWTGPCTVKSWVRISFPQPGH